ncbi:MAG: SDR family oxidoreductase, partial [Cryomorphaceae bacterium]|nr:SDR family oxidoreductase [Cryomorphaceae bacterium]
NAVLVTGANGLLGSAIFRLIKGQSRLGIYATGRGERRPSVPEDIPYMPCDLEDEKSVKVMLDKVKPDVIIHAAAMTQVDACEHSPEACMRANVNATQYLLRHSSKGTRMVLVSTDFVFDGQKAMYRETDTPNPISVYGESKLMAEKEVINSGKSYAILRTMLVYGYAPKLSRSNIVLWVVDSLKNGKNINVVDDQFRGPTHVDNLAQACVLACDSDKVGIYHISSSDYINMYDFACKIADIWQLDDALITPIKSSELGQPAARPPKTGFVVDKAIEELSFRPVSIDEGLRRMHKQMTNLE